MVVWVTVSFLSVFLWHQQHICLFITILLCGKITLWKFSKQRIWYQQPCQVESPLKQRSPTIGRWIIWYKAAKKEHICVKVYVFHFLKSSILFYYYIFQKILRARHSCTRLTAGFFSSFFNTSLSLQANPCKNDTKTNKLLESIFEKGERAKDVTPEESESANKKKVAFKRKFQESLYLNCITQTHTHTETVCPVWNWSMIKKGRGPLP